jgi:hypothetical protein
MSDQTRPGSDDDEIRVIRGDRFATAAQGLKSGKGKPTSGAQEAQAEARGPRRWALGVYRWFHGAVTRRNLPPEQSLWIPEATRLAVRAHEERAFDAIFITGRPFSSFYVGRAMNRRFGTPVALDLRDPWSPMERRGSLSWATARLHERAVFKAADVIFLNTESSKSAYAEIVDERTRPKLVCAPNGLSSYPSTSREPKSLPFTIVHGGNLYGRPLTPLVEGFARLVESRGLGVDEVRLVVVGNLDGQKVPTELVKRLGERLNIAPWMPYAAYQGLLRSASCMGIIQGDFDLCIPGKFYEGLATGKPILLLADPHHELVTILEEELGAGAAADGRDPEAIKDAIGRIIDEVDDRLHQAPLTREVLAPYHIETRMELIVDHLENIAAAKSPGTNDAR